MKNKTNAVRILEKKAIEHRLIEYRYREEDLSVEQIAVQNGLPVERIFKTLVAKGDKTGVVVAVVPGHRSLDLKKLATAGGNKKTTLVAVREIQALTGYIRGGCSPIGMKKDYPVVIDEAAAAWESIFVNAGARGLLLEIAPEALRQATRGAFGDISA